MKGLFKISRHGLARIQLVAAIFIEFFIASQVTFEGWQNQAVTLTRYLRGSLEVHRVITVELNTSTFRNEFNKMFNNLSFHKQYKLIQYLQLNINGHTRSPQLYLFELLPKSLPNEGYPSWWTLVNKRQSSSSAL